MKPILFATVSAALTASLLSGCAGAQTAAAAPAATVHLSKAQLASVGNRVWRNESGGTVQGLAAWNQGEDFASLGIGHFIWYPAGQQGPFEESFPELVGFLAANRVALPAWLTPRTPCPWNTRTAFLGDRSGRVAELRQLLSRTVDLQAQFLLNRLNASLPKMLAAAAPQDRNRVRVNFQTLADTAPGAYALIDYVNFKGEGVKPEERYNGQGWGLLQVLSDMNAPTSNEFSAAAGRVLTRRVKNAPASRGEGRWLQGWLNRCATYRG